VSEVLTDGIHLVCADDEALHRFARGIGLRRSWFQSGRFPHYDLTSERMVTRALKAGACRVESRELVRLMRRGAA